MKEGKVTGNMEGWKEGRKDTIFTNNLFRAFLLSLSCSLRFFFLNLTHSLIHYFENVPNSKKLQTTNEMRLLKDFKIHIA